MYGTNIFFNEQRKIVQRSLDAGATSPSLAKSIEQVGIHPNLTIERLIAGQILRHAEDGQLYVDEKAWAASSLRRWLTIVGIVVFLAVCYAAYFFLTREL